MLGMKAALEAPPSALPSLLFPLPSPSFLPQPSAAAQSLSQSRAVQPGCLVVRIQAPSRRGCDLRLRAPQPLPPSPSVSAPQPRPGPHTLGHGFPLPQDEPQTGGEVGGGECAPLPWARTAIRGLGPPSLGWERLTPQRLTCAPHPASLNCQGRRGEGELREKVGNSRGPD